MKFEKHTITNFHISYKANSFHVELYKSGDFGSSLYWYEDEKYEIIWYASDHAEATVQTFIKKLNTDFKKSILQIYNEIGGVFEIFIYNKENYKLLVLNDLYGINGSYYSTANNTLFFFLNFQNFRELNIPLRFDKKGLQMHFAFGYQVKPFSLPFQNIKRISDGNLHKFNPDLSVEKEPLTIHPMEEIPQKSLKNNFSDTENYYIGATAGKDSLAIISQTQSKQKNICLGNFGNLYAADVIQGKEIAVKLDLPYSHTELCDPFEFEYYATKIAMISGGMATISYVDMLKFVDEGIPKHYNFVMGEGGECVRMFFSEDNDISKAIHNYLTPRELLYETFNDSYREGIETYTETISKSIEENYSGDTNAEKLINFYRNGRLPGNFGNRHKLISAFRNKITPFLQHDFIQATHFLPYSKYKHDKIHEQIIYQNNQRLLHFFKNPIEADETVQEWEHRMKNEIGVKLYQLLLKHIHALETVFNTEKVLELAKKQQKNPDRGMYFLFRIVAMAIFVNSIQNAATCEKR